MCSNIPRSPLHPQQVNSIIFSRYVPATTAGVVFLYLQQVCFSNAPGVFLLHQQVSFSVHSRCVLTLPLDVLLASQSASLAGVFIYALVYSMVSRRCFFLAFSAGVLPFPQRISSSIFYRCVPALSLGVFQHLQHVCSCLTGKCICASPAGVFQHP